MKGGMRIMNLLGNVELKSSWRSPFLFCVLTLALIVGCSATAPVKAPNINALYRVPSLQKELPPLPDNTRLVTQEPLPQQAQIAFQRLFGVNRTLALEAGRLPAFQKGIKEKEILAITRLIELVENATPEQKTNLESLLNIGLKDSRRYSSPLEAVFWILEKDDYDGSKQVLQLPLEELLDKAWDFSDRTRWGDYETVTDRLNAPELVNYYQRLRLLYKTKIGRRDATIGDARDLFEGNIGNCYDHSKFATYCLEKAGYTTSIVGVHPVRPSLHVVCRYEANGKSYFIDNGRPDKFLRRGIIPKEEYEMYREEENVRKAQGTRDPVYLVQDNHGLALVYLIAQKDRVTSVNAICKDLGLSGLEEKVRNEYLPALIDSGFITKPIPHKGAGSENFEYTINKSLCERFKAARYHRPLNAVAKW
jgi:hypothetical protein